MFGYRTSDTSKQRGETLVRRALELIESRAEDVSYLTVDDYRDALRKIGATNDDKACMLAFLISRHRGNVSYEVDSLITDLLHDVDGHIR